MDLAIPVTIMVTSTVWFFVALFWQMQYKSERTRADTNEFLHKEYVRMLDTAIDLLTDASGKHLNDLWELADLKMHTLESEMEKVSMLGPGVWVGYDKYGDQGMFTVLLGDERLCDTDEPAKALREYREKLDAGQGSAQLT